MNWSRSAMVAETLIQSCLQAGVLILVLWAFLRLYPAVSPNTQVWLWRLVYLKLALGAAGLLTVPLHVLPAETATVYAGEVVAVPESAAGPNWILGLWLLGLGATAGRAAWNIRR